MMLKPRSAAAWLAAGLLAGVWSVPIAAQTVTDCESYVSSAQLIAEPWADNSATYAEGAIRVAVMDTVEPAAGAFHLMVLSPPYDEGGFRGCHLVSETTGIGFGGLKLQGVEPAYDAATGLTLRLPTSFWLPDTDTYVDGMLVVTINQQSGEITAVAERP